MTSTHSALFVRGTTVDPSRRFSERHEGTPEWAGFLDTLDTDERRLLDEPVKRRRWYDLTLYSSILEAASRHLASDDPDGFLRDLGHFVFDDGVKTLYKPFFFICSPSFVIKGAAVLWTLFFKGSRLKVLERRSKSVRVAIQDASFCSEALCQTVSGGMMSALKHAGARNVRCDHQECCSTGGHQCEFRFSWN